MAAKKRARAAKSARKSAPKARAPKAPPAPKMISVRAKQPGTYGATLYNAGQVFLIEQPAKDEDFPSWVEALSDKEVKDLAQAEKAAAEAKEIG